MKTNRFTCLLEQSIKLVLIFVYNCVIVIFLTSAVPKDPILPGDFATKVKQINSQSDLIWMSSFAGPSYLTIRSSVYII